MTMKRPESLTDEFLQSLVARVPSTSGGTYKLTEVYTGEVIIALPQSTPADIEAAYVDARVAQTIWATWPLKQAARGDQEVPRAAARQRTRSSST